MLDPSTQRMLANRSAAALERGDHILYPAQQMIARAHVERLKAGSPEDYFVGMPGIGKTVIVLHTVAAFNTAPRGEQMWDVPCIILVPTKDIRGQFYEKATGLLRIPPEVIGVYDPSISNREQRFSVFDKPVLIMSYAAGRRIIRSSPAIQKRIGFDLAKYKATLLDEVHMDPRGDLTGQVLRDHCFDKMYILGDTATHLYPNGRTVGDYIFQGRCKPFYEQTPQEAVNLGSMASTINIIGEVVTEPGAQVVADREIPERAKDKLVTSGALLQQGIRMLQKGKHPISGKPFREMKSVWFTESVDEAHLYATAINEAMGRDNYAAAISGRPKDAREWEKRIRKAHQSAHLAIVPANEKLLSLTNNQFIQTGYDDDSIEIVYLDVTRSPIRSMQSGGRATRIDPSDPRKVKLVVNLIPEHSHGIIWGELAGGLVILREDFEYGPTFRREEYAGLPNERPEPEEPPLIDGLRTYSTPRQLAFFQQKRQEQQWRDKLPVKQDHMLTVEEMAKELHVAPEILQRQIFKYLEDAFNIRTAEQRYVAGRDIAPEEGDTIPLRGQRFSIGRMGYYKEGKKPVFWLDKEAAGLCRYILFGHISDKGSEWMNRHQARIVLDIGDTAMTNLCRQIEEAYIARSPYQRVLPFEIEGTEGKKMNVSVPIEHVLFFKEKSAVQVGFAPEAFISLYQIVNKVDRTTAEKWWDKHRILPNLKSHEWYTDIEFARDLDIDSNNDRFRKLWSECRARARSGTHKLGEHVIFGEEKSTFADLRNKVFCMHRSEREWIKWKLGMENAYDPAEDKAFSRTIGL